ncbi:MAG: GAF domain-containing protein [Sandaracinaceae bacterium]|nr:GAF domain-containing protein [Sandaracinaceae bacterium]
MSKRWRIEVSALGSDEAKAEATVDAANWMTALKAGRAALGESGGLPPGANLRHESGGAVTIHDARERKTYRLFPADAAPAPAAAPAPSPDAPVKKARPKTIAYIPAEDVATALGGAAAFAPTKPAPVQPSPQPVAAAPVATAAPAPEPEPAPLSAKKKMAMTVAYTPGDDLPASPKQVFVGDQATADTFLDAPLPAAPTPAAAPLVAPVSDPDDDPILTEVDVELLLSRDAEPSDQNPLRYRERVFVVPPTLTQTEAEAVARGELETLQAELESFPTGKYVSIAVFDHAWDEHPARPPIVTLDWKDWHGDAVVAYPLATQPGRPLSVAPGPILDQSERLSAAFEACQDLFFLERPIDALEFAVRLLAELLPTDVTIASIYDIDTDELRAASVLGVDGIAGRAARAGTGLLGVAAQDAAVALRVHDLTADARFVHAAEGVPGMKTGAAIYMAIARQGRLYGMLQLFRRGEPRFTRNDAELVRYVGEQVGEFMAQFKTVQARAPRA